MITEIALEGYKQYTESIIKSADIKLDGTYYPTTVQKKERLTDGRIAVYLLIDNTDTENERMISEVRIFNTNDEVWLVKSENIKIKQESLLYRFIIGIEEG
ncbi:hypothetical protein [Vallitalea guaymasensis]|uniref:hypothetical protein n=1 Tax=Vallitalea guaymasensis TaxID=1185412 RepID=UPI000DE467DD|nr:hypothetical protein [Vallitalea guaymasensis]